MNPLKRLRTEGVIREFQAKYRFLSNFIPSVREGKPFSVELLYQAFKARSAGLSELEERILKLPPTHIGCKTAKHLAKHLPRPSNALQYMEDLVRWKFQDPVFKRLLLSTGEAELVEGNLWHDNFWGICTCSMHYGSGLGENHLGRILMKIRRELRNERESD